MTRSRYFQASRVSANDDNGDLAEVDDLMRGGADEDALQVGKSPRGEHDHRGALLLALFDDVPGDGPRKGGSHDSRGPQPGVGEFLHRGVHHGFGGPLEIVLERSATAEGDIALADVQDSHVGISQLCQLLGRIQRPSSMIRTVQFH